MARANEMDAAPVPQQRPGFMDFPKRMFRQGEAGRLESKVFRSQDEVSAAGKGWVESPTDAGFEPPPPRPGNVLERPPAGSDIETLTAGIGSLPSPQAIQVTDMMTSVEMVDRALVQENARPSGSRQQVIEAMAKRRVALERGQG